jgi:hypothetical protein
VTAIVNPATIFAIGQSFRELTMGLKVSMTTEKKAVTGSRGGTKVTSSFGLVFANI